MKKIKYLLFLGLMSITTLCVSCTDSKAEDAGIAENKPVQNKDNIATSPILLLQPQYEITVPGKLEPAEQVSLYAKVNGFVKKLHVDIGDKVKKGQLLAILEAPEMDQKFVSDRSTEHKLHSDYLYAKQNLERLKEAAKTEGAVAAIELDRAESAMKSAKSAYQSSKAQTGHSAQMQQYLQLLAPFDGIITQRNVSEGALVGPGSGQPILKIADEGNLRLKISLPEKHAGSTYKDLKAVFSVNTHPGKNFEAELSRSSQIIHSIDRALALEFDVNNKDQKLNGGEYAQVSLKLERKDSTFWVNPKSVLRTQSGLFVLRKNKEELERIAVREGNRLDTIVEIFGRLKRADKIVQKPNELM